MLARAPATTTMISRQSRATRVTAPAGRSLNPSGYIVREAVDILLGEAGKGNRRLLPYLRRKSSLLHPEEAAVAACSGPSTTSGSPPR